MLAYARDFMINKGFTYVIPPFMMHGNVVQGVMSFPEMDAMMYKIEGEDLYLIGTSEHRDRPLHRPDSGRGHSAPDPDLLQPLLPQGKGRSRHRGRGIYAHPISSRSRK